MDRSKLHSKTLHTKKKVDPFDGNNGSKSVSKQGGNNLAIPSARVADEELVFD